MPPSVNSENAAPTVRYLANVDMAVVKFEKNTPSEVISGAVGDLIALEEVQSLEADQVVMADHLLRGLHNEETPNNSRVPPPQVVSLDKMKSVISGTDMSGNAIPDDQNLEEQWGLEDINAFVAWDVHTGETGAEIKVCVVDTGVDLDHNDLVANVFVNDAEQNGVDGVDDDANGYVDDVYGWNALDNSATPDDDDGHGSHCAGVIGAMTNNNLGIAGINWKPKIVACKFLDSDGYGTIAGAVECIDYTIAVGCAVANHSWGSTSTLDAVETAMLAAGAAGQVFVTSAGNYGDNVDITPTYPGSYNKDFQISVAALEEGNNLASYSNYSPNLIHIAAPGSYIFSTYVDGSYAYLSGTSMASPHVAGAVSLLLSQDPSLAIIDVKHILQMTAAPFTNWAGLVKWGKLDLHAAIMFELPTGQPGISTTETTMTTTAGTTMTMTTTFPTTSTYHDHPWPTTTPDITTTPFHTPTSPETTMTMTGTTTMTMTTTYDHPWPTLTQPSPTPPAGNFVMVSADLTCQSGCEQHNMYCDNDMTKAADTDIDLCYDGLVASGYGVDTPLTKGGINDSVLAPGGCYAEMYSVVHLNSN
eukprot:CAMPEP_0113859390 /NCGR_PEP_ID=MMETSP0372-20130328/12303_1 /TAXON_ID=340204 /ORGANISM="Lankesteria abbotti" /LENGTH=587 /DNA_ID=CAMNT_0000837573 /DNA_START=260 /DNA_END=2020 /DNA_ORIENTATION=+ /assembly_acc=CAM_ASM_000359